MTIIKLEGKKTFLAYAESICGLSILPKVSKNPKQMKELVHTADAVLNFARGFQKSKSNKGACAYC